MAEKKIRLEDLQSPIVSRRKGDDRFRTVGVIGLGVMGQGIAETVAGSGIDVIAVEKTEATLKEGMDGLSSAMDLEIKRWGKTTSEKRAVMSRIRGTTSIAELKECDIIIEAVDENFELKTPADRGLLRRRQGRSAVFISNTATLSLTKLAAGASRATGSSGCTS